MNLSSNACGELYIYIYDPLNFIQEIISRPNTRRGASAEEKFTIKSSKQRTTHETRERLRGWEKEDESRYAGEMLRVRRGEKRKQGQREREGELELFIRIAKIPRAISHRDTICTMEQALAGLRHTCIYTYIHACMYVFAGRVSTRDYTRYLGCPEFSTAFRC